METILTVTLLGLIKAKTLYMQEVKIPVAYAENIPLEAPKSPDIDSWIDKLAQCESSNNEKALNPKDTDGTPSKGRFQFKDSTFNYFSGKYKIATTSIWNGNEQEQILRRMINDPSVNLRNQFPACVRKLGLPNQVE